MKKRVFKKNTVFTRKYGLVIREIAKRLNISRSAVYILDARDELKNALKDKAMQGDKK
jgi:transposase